MKKKPEERSINQMYPPTAMGRIFDAVNVIFMLALCFITLYPLYYIAVVSVSGNTAVLQGTVHWFPKDFTLDSYRAILKFDLYLNSYKNTIVYTIFGTLINLVMTALCAYPLSRRDFYGRKVIMFLITVTMFFNGGLIPTYLLVISLGLNDSVWALVLPTAISTYNMIVMRTFFQNLPQELHESAYLDGANDLVIFLRIILPLSGVIMATMMMFYAVGHWNNYFEALIYMNSRSKQTVQLILRNILLTDSNSNSASEVTTTATKSYQYAAIMCAVLPIICVYPFIQKYFVKGVMIGSIKG